MKILVAVFFLATNAFAGTPEQDPLIAKIRQEFQAAGVPTLANLQIGKRWICSTFMADFNNFKHSQTPTELGHFEPYNGLLRITRFGKDVFFALSQGQLLSTFEGGNGSITSNNYYQARITKMGDLILEEGFDYGRPRPYSNESGCPPALAFSGYRAIDYVVCPISELLP